MTPTFSIRRLAPTLVFALGATLHATAAHAQKVALVSVGNELPSGGWCDVNYKTLAAGAVRSYRIEGRIDNAQYSSINGKFRMKNETNFEWASGEPAVAFTQNGSSPATYSIRAKATAAANTYTITFVAVDDANAESASKTCKITVSGTAGTPAKPDLSNTITRLKREGGDWLQQVDTISTGKKLSLRVEVRNTRSNVPSPAARVVLNRFDQSCSGMPVVVETAKPVPALAGGAVDSVDFTDQNPPNLGTAASATVCYKAGFQTAAGGYYTDSLSTNNTPTRIVKYVAGGTAPPSVTFATYLFAQFSNAKCVNCHAFTDPNSAKRIAHNSRIATGADVTNPTTCSGCHNSSTTCEGAPGCVANWHAAPASANWTGKTAQAMCEHVKTAALPAGHTMSTHLKDDTFVRWALGKMSVALSTWNAKVDEWISGGLKCS